MAKNNNLTDFLTDVANTIRAKKNLSSPLDPQDFSDEIATISAFKPEGPLSVTPTTVAQTIYPSEGEVFNVVNVSAVTSAIDSNIQAGNIKKGVNILGVSGILEGGGGSANDALSVFNKTITELVDTNGTIQSMGEMTSCFVRCLSLSQINLPACTAIGSSMFRGCSNLTTVSLPVCDSLKDSAFENTGLISIALPSCDSIGQNAFKNCSKLTTVDFPMIDELNTGCFWNCSNLTNVNLSSCYCIGEHAFDGCLKLTSIVTSDIETVRQFAFNNCPLSVFNFSTVEEINSAAFKGTNLTSISFGNSVSIGSAAFEDCKQLQTIFNDNEFNEISTFAFEGCTALTTISGDWTCDTIQEHAFEGCTALEEIDFTEHSIHQVEVLAFCGCSSLDITFDSDIKISSGAFSGIHTATFKDTVSRLEEMRQDGDVANDAFNDNFVIHCSDGDYTWHEN